MSTPQHSYHQQKVIQHVRALVKTTGINYPDSIGSLSQLFADHQPQTLEEWVTVFDTKRPGKRTLEQCVSILDAANTNTTFSREDLSTGLKQFYYSDTFFGLSKERVAIKNLDDATAHLPGLRFYQDSTKDGKNGVDILVDYQGKLLLTIQVKPSSYFFNTPYLVEARAFDKVKMDAFTASTGIPIEFLVYDSDTKAWTESFNTVVATITKLVNGKKMAAYEKMTTKLLSKSTGIDALCEDLEDDELDILIQVLQKKQRQRKG